MDRRYYRQYENFDTVVPKIDDFPILGRCEKQDGKSIIEHNTNTSSIKMDDLILLGILVILLFSEEKDISGIISIVFLFLSEYIF